MTPLFQLLSGRNPHYSTADFPSVTKLPTAPSEELYQQLHLGSDRVVRALCRCAVLDPVSLRYLLKRNIPSWDAQECVPARPVSVSGTHAVVIVGRNDYEACPEELVFSDEWDLRYHTGQSYSTLRDIRQNTTYHVETKEEETSSGQHIVYPRFENRSLPFRFFMQSDEASILHIRFYSLDDRSCYRYLAQELYKADSVEFESDILLNPVQALARIATNLLDRDNIGVSVSPSSS